MNKGMPFPPEMAKMVMEKVMERVKQGDVKAIAIKFGQGEMEDEEEGYDGESEGSGEMCSKCGHKCSMEDNYCPSCGNDINKEEMKEEKVEEKQGDNGGSNEEEMSDEEKNIMKLKEYSKKK
jgi:hypothetical protein